MLRARFAIVVMVLASGVVMLYADPWVVSDRAPNASPQPSATATTGRSPSPEPAPALNLTRAVCGRGGRTVSFRIAVDKGLRTTAADFGRAVRATLCDDRSWIASGKVRFRYNPRSALLIGLRTPDDSETRCRRLVGLTVRRFYSCGTPAEVVINSDRWFKNSPYFPESLAIYRDMVVNHEAGHALGLHHVSCPANKQRAPLMMQQSKGMRSANGNACLPNAWPLQSELALLG